MRGNNKKPSYSIPEQFFPSQYVSDSEKESKDWGRKIGQAIQYEWFRSDGTSIRFFDRWDKYHIRRLYARGEQPTDKYKKEIAYNGDISHLNLDWTPVPIIPKFVDVIVNGMSEREFEVTAYSQDPVSAEKRSQYQDNLEADMISKDIMLQIQNDFGVDTFNINPEELPRDEDELAVHMQLDYKPDIEVAEEVAINTIFDYNRFDRLRKQLCYDIVVDGEIYGKHEFQPGGGVVLSRVDGANVVHSFSEDIDRRDCFYWGEIKTVHINEVSKINPKLSSKDLEDIQEISASWYDQHQRYGYYKNSVFDKDLVTLMYFDYKTTSKIVYKKKVTDKGVEKVIAKDDTWDPDQEMMDRAGFEKIEKEEEVWYTGVMVLGTDHVLQWEKMQNMVRPESATQYAMSRYISCAPKLYKGVVESLVRRMIPFADLIQMTHLKLQQVIQRVVPDGIFIDADGINEVDLGNGGTYSPDDALRLYFQTGSVVGRSLTQDGEFNHARVPIEELNKNSGQNKINSLITSYNQYLSMIRDVTGLNEAVDASKPDPNSLVGLQKLAALNSNTATRHVLEGVLEITKQFAEAVSLRVSDILKNSEYKDEFAMQIGKYNVSILEDIKNLHLHSFGIFIEVAPDADERERLEANIQMALSKELIELDDVYDIREARNITMANKILKIKKRRKQERDRKIAQEDAQMQAQINMQSQQMASQQAIMKIEAETRGKIMEKQAEAGFKIETMAAEVRAKEQLMAQEFYYEMQLKGIDVAALTDKEAMKEDRKDQRTKIQASQQSKMIDQRKKNTGPINFESTEDTLDGFDLAEFGPK